MLSAAVERCVDVGASVVRTAQVSSALAQLCGVVVERGLGI